jgi:hypothetical protein
MSCISNSSDINQTFIIEPVMDDIYTTGATLINNVLYFDRTDSLSAYTANLNSLIVTDTYVTGVTFSNNYLTITRNDGISLTAEINSLTGLTVNGSVSATTFFGDGSNLSGITTRDTYVTGGTYSNGTSIFRNNTGGTFSVIGFSTGYTLTSSAITSTLGYVPMSANTYVTGLTFNNSTYDLKLTRNDGVNLIQNLSILASDVTITGGTYNVNSGNITFTNNTGGTFSISGFSSGMTDSYTTGATLNGNTIQFNNNLQGTNFYSVNLTPLLSGKTNLDLFISHTGNTNNPHETSFNNLISTAHTHTINDVIGLQQSLDSKLFISGGTINGSLSANTLSATTYNGYIPYNSTNPNGYISGITFSSVTSALGFVPVSADTNTYVTGGTYSNGTAIFRDNSGTTFNVTGFTTPFTGGTVSGSTIFTNGLSANTISATTYYNLPLDIRLTGNTFNVKNKTLTSSRNDNFNIDVILPVRTFLTAETTTINNSLKTIDVISGLTDNSNIFIISYINAFKDSNDYGFWKRTIAVNKVSGLVNIIGENADFDRISSGMTPNSVIYSANNGNVLIQISGETAKTYTWSSNWEIIK